MTNIFLNKFANKKSVNTSEGVNVSLKGRRKLLPNNDIANALSQYEVYQDERRKCNIIRLTCQVNPICSNVLHNSITEIVKNEGSANVSFVNYGIFNDSQVGSNIVGKDKSKGFWNNYEAIRDTQLSNDGYVYHCGIDIFNNHLIRSNSFKTVCKINGKNRNFNTIEDYMRTVEGQNVEEYIPFPMNANIIGGTKHISKMHLYNYDDLYTFDEAVANRREVNFNGWVGFYNKSKIKSYSNYQTSTPMDIERPLMNHNGGDFVNMYPDRSLYSFVPKYNPYRKRVEKNWNYCLTYPSSSTTNGFNDIIETNNGVNSLKAIYFNENTIADNGVRQLVIYGIAKHGLFKGNRVNIYNTIDNETTMILPNAEVMEVVNDYIFTVASTIKISSKWVQIDGGQTGITIDGNDYDIGNGKVTHVDTSTNKLLTYYIVGDTNYVNLDDNAQNISYKRVVNGIECDYYVRIFSKIPNFKNASADTSNEYEIYKDDAQLIKTYQDNKYDFENHISRLAFAKNIYSDDIGQVVFTDNIDISNLKDNLGRPLSSIYLTFVKNNAGYKEWYGFKRNWKKEDDIKDSAVEYSHCFGKITCGVETSEESMVNNSIKSIYTINNISGMRGYNIDVINGDRDSQQGTDDTPQEEISFKQDKNYYGDLCCYDNYNAVETSIQPIMHRFNTAQRESQTSSSRSYFNYFKYDKVKSDDYDEWNNFTIEVATKSDCNRRKEGYYYNPHYEIKIKTFDRLESVMPDFLSVVKKQIDNKIENNIIYYKVTFSCLQNHYLSIGDKSVVYDKTNNVYYDCTTISDKTDDYKTFTCVMYNENGEMVNPDNVFYETIHQEGGETKKERPLNEFKFFKIDNLAVPSYAKILKDGTCRITWRNLLNNGFDSNDGIEEYPFTNGAFYINKTINIYVRRQDPYGIWGLYSSEDIGGDDIFIDQEDNYIKADEIVC